MTFFQGLAATLLRVWAAMIIVYGLYSIVSVGMAAAQLWGATDMAGRRYHITSLAHSLILFAMGVAVWSQAIPLGRRLGGAVSAAAAGITVSAEQLVAIGAFLIGLFYIVGHGPRALTDLAIVFIAIAQQTDDERLAGAHVVIQPGWREVISTWAVVIAGIFVMLRARDVARLFAWLREAGLPPATAKEESTETPPPRR